MAKKNTYVPVNCYHCGEPISEIDLVHKSFPVHTVVRKVHEKNIYNPLVERELHYYCAPELAKAMNMQEEIDKEEEDFRKCYARFCQWYEVRPLDKFTIARLRGMRVGAYTSRGKNTRSVQKGHSFEIIYLTMLLVEPDVIRVLNHMNFNDNQHRTNYVMKIIEGRLDELQMKHNALQRHKRHVESISLDVSSNPRAEYINKVDQEIDLVNKVINNKQAVDKIDFEDLF